MGADGNIAGFILFAGKHADHIAHRIDVDIVQFEFAETILQPVGARRFAKGRRRDARQFHLPLLQLESLCAGASQKPRAPTAFRPTAPPVAGRCGPIGFR